LAIAFCLSLSKERKGLRIAVSHLFTDRGRDTTGFNTGNYRNYRRAETPFIIYDLAYDLHLNMRWLAPKYALPLLPFMRDPCT
jgi:hypothetical protein